jgi:class 3 adenylate cyclase
LEEGNKKIIQSNPVERAINLAFDLKNVVSTIKWGNSNELKIKIGINYGRVMAGVIGHHKPQFSLIGDTINTTSRVMSTGLVICNFYYV